MITRIIDRAVNALCSLAYAVGVLAVMAMMVLVTADVVSLYAFSSPIPWTQEITSAYFMVAVIFLPMGYVTIKEGQISLELFQSFLSERLKFAMEIFQNLLTILYMSFMTYATTIEAIAATKVTEGWTSGRGDIPVWISRWILPYSSTVMVLALLWILVRLIRTGKDGVVHVPAGEEA